MTNEKHSTSKSSTILISLGTYPNDQPMAYTSPKLYVMPRYVTRPRISSTGLDYSSTNRAKNISPKNGCWQPWRNVAGRTPGLWINTTMGWTIIWRMIVGALIHEAGTVIQAPKPVCQFMAEDIPPPVLYPYPTTSINSLVRIKEPSSPTGWQQSPQLQAEETKKSRKLDCVATGFIYDDAVNFTVDVRLSVRPSVTPFSPCSHHRIIIEFSGVITMIRSNVHAKGQGQRSMVKVTEVNTQLSRFQTLTPVWIHIWQWNHAHSWKQHRRGALLFFKVIRQISRSQGSKNCRIWPKLGISRL